MNIKFAVLVKRMRSAQRKYFRTRSPIDLMIAKDLEIAVDSRIEEIMRGSNADES